MIIVISSNPNSLAEYLETIDGETGTIEAEYGDIMVRGSAFSLGHHGPRSANQPPCLVTPWSLPVVECIGLSHVDLDALMGVGIAMGRSYPVGFAQLVGFVDCSGAHRAPEHPEWARWAPELQAFWAWNDGHRVYPPSDGGVAEIAESVELALTALDICLVGDPELLEAGRVWAAEIAELNRASFVRASGPGGVLLRVADRWVNHLYRGPGPEGETYEALVGLNTARNSITVSFAYPENFTAPEFKNCPAQAVVQALWGPEAGGGPGAAGSPRNRVMTIEDAELAYNELKRYF